MRVLCLHGISKDAWNRYSEKGNWYYEVLEPGFKYNLSDVQSAIGIHQLEKIERFHALRAAYAGHLQPAAGRCGRGRDAARCASYGRHAWHLYSIRLRLETLAIGRDEFIVELRERGVGTSVHFIPIPLHPFFQRWARSSAATRARPRWPVFAADLAAAVSGNEHGPGHSCGRFGEGDCGGEIAAQNGGRGGCRYHSGKPWDPID